MRQEIIETDKAPAAIGPYVQGRRIGPFIYTSGQIGMDPATGKVVGGGIVPQTKRALENMAAIVQAGGGDLPSIFKTTLFLKNMNDFDTVNAVYEAFFGGHKPARSTVEVARLPKDVLIEIECIAYVPRQD